MKAVRVSVAADGTCTARPLAFPSAYRTGAGDPEIYRLRARGEAPLPTRQLAPCGPLHTIRLSQGRVDNFASQPGALLTFVITGQLELAFPSGEAVRMEPGDMLLIDEGGVSKTTFAAADDSRLIQLGVGSDWPGDASQHQGPGTIVSRPHASNIKRVFTDDEQRSQFSEFGKLFSAPTGQWAAGKSVEGFRFLSWEDGLMDWHPNVINQIAIFLSGKTEVEVGGGGGDSQFFYAGDVCLCEDRTGEGHVDRLRGLTHMVLLEVANEHLW